MTAGRYRIKQEDAGWTIYDCGTGEPALIGRRRQTGLDEPQADQLCEALNEQRTPGAAVRHPDRPFL
jgi:hypothetical protein